MKRNTLIVFLGAVTLIGLACVATLPRTAPIAILQPTRTATSSPTATPTPGPTNTPLPTSTRTPAARLFTGTPQGKSHPVQIIGSVSGDFKSFGVAQGFFTPRIVWVKDVRFDYSGGTVLLSGSASGTKPLTVDDVLIIQVVHLGQKADTLTIDFSKDASSPRLEGPFDVTDFFRAGPNMLYIQIYDYGYSGWGTSGVWLVEYK